MTAWDQPDRFLDIIKQPEYRQLVMLQDGLQRDSTMFWLDRNVRFVHLPITTNAVSSPMGLGSDSRPLAVEIAGKPCYLADSMQFMLEYACRFNPNGAWYAMPSFRAEPADETHLNEFFHSEAEISGGLADVMKTVESYLRTITAGALYRMRRRSLPGQDLSHIERFLASDSVPAITFEEAAARFGAADEFVQDHGSWRTITRRGERELANMFGGAVWLTHFDHLSVPFYQAYSNDRKTAANADLLFPVGELVGAGERHMTGQQVREALEHHQVPEDQYAWYTQMKDVYPMRTAGFGMGIERWLMWLTQASDIRDLSIAPRIHGTATIP
jgi:asparaginyl-tRNA synthetase